MDLRQHFGRQPKPSLWPPIFCVTLCATAWVAVLFGSIRSDLDADRKKFVADDNAARRRDAAERCIAGRVDQLVRVSMPISTPSSVPASAPAAKSGRTTKRDAPTSVVHDCEDAGRERAESR